MKAAVQSVLFGFDFFIAYRSADGSAFARSLHAGLEKKGFDCFLDEQHYEAGHNLRWMQSQALRRSSKLLVIVSPRANRSPPSGIDWLLAEITEFKHLASQRGRQAEIVPIGTSSTLNAETYPDSRLLPEIPSLRDADICILDPATEQNGDVSRWTIEKLEIDFRQARRRAVRVAMSILALVSIAIATGFGIQAVIQRERDGRLVEAFRALDLGRTRLDRSPAVAISQVLFGISNRLFTELALDPLLALHHQSAARLQQLRANPIAKVGNEVSGLWLSADGDWMLIVYDYQAPNGAPDREDIAEAIAFGVLDLQKREWTLRRTLNTAIGAELYDGADIEAFEPPHHVILRVDSGDGGVQLQRVSLEDGARAIAEWKAPTPLSPVMERKAPPAALERLLEPKNLFTIDPQDGLDLEYGPRLVPQTYVEAPDRRTAIVGTWEGRLMLVDLATGLLRGELHTSAIFAAAYRPDSGRAYFCDSSDLWEVDTSGWNGLTEFTIAVADGEAVQAASLSDDGAVLAIATSDRLLTRTRDGTTREWSLPRRLAQVAVALRVDRARSRVDVVADDGLVASAVYDSASSQLEIVSRPEAGESMVAWLEAEPPAVWLVPERPRDASEVRVTIIPLPGGSAVPRSVALPPMREGDSIHAIAKVGDVLSVFRGDQHAVDPTLPEELLLVHLNAAHPPLAQMVFPIYCMPNGPDTLCTTTFVDRVLPGSRPGRLIAKTDDGRVHVIDAEARKTTIGFRHSMVEYQNG